MAMSDSQDTGAPSPPSTVKLLAASHELLAAQMAELAIGQQAATKERREQGMRMTQIEELLDRNTQMTAQMLDVVSAVKGGIKVLGWIGIAAKWLGGIAAACAALYTILYMVTHGGHKP